MSPFSGGLVRARELVAVRFGHAALRVHQIRVLGPLLGGRSVLAVLPTGAGKSLCYQLPALMAPGLTLVVSPLISLMQDQVAALRRRRIAAAYLSSSLSAEQRRAVLDAALPPTDPRGGRAYHPLHTDAPAHRAGRAGVAAHGRADGSLPRGAESRHPTRRATRLPARPRAGRGGDERFRDGDRQAGRATRDPLGPAADAGSLLSGSRPGGTRRRRR